MDFDGGRGDAMKVNRGDYFIELPEKVDPDSLAVSAYSAGIEKQTPGGYWIAVYRVEFAELHAMSKRQRDVAGVPVQFALEQRVDGDRLHLHPVNDIDRDVSIRYCGAAKFI